MTSWLRDCSLVPRIAYCIVVFLGLSATSRADRIVLAPGGLVTTPGVARIELAALGANSHTNMQWFNAGLIWPQTGIELEAERDESPGKRTGTFSLQYTFTGNAFSDIAPAVSIGMRDFLDNSREGRALFAAATKTFGFSRQQEHFIRDLKLHAGYGTSRLGGLYVGSSMRFTIGFSASVEYVAHQFNAEVVIPVARNFNLRGYSLNGDLFYGASITLKR